MADEVNASRNALLCDIVQNSSTYWEGRSDMETLQRIYGVSFPDANMLKQWERFQDEAKNRDHRKIGKVRERPSYKSLSLRYMCGHTVEQSAVPHMNTFMHLADAFIQRDLQCIQAIHVLSVHVFSGNRTHNLLCC